MTRLERVIAEQKEQLAACEASVERLEKAAADAENKRSAEVSLLNRDEPDVIRILRRQKEDADARRLAAAEQADVYFTENQQLRREKAALEEALEALKKSFGDHRLSGEKERALAVKKIENVINAVEANAFLPAIVSRRVKDFFLNAFLQMFAADSKTTEAVTQNMVKAGGASPSFDMLVNIVLTQINHGWMQKHYWCKCPSPNSTVRLHYFYFKTFRCEGTVPFVTWMYLLKYGSSVVGKTHVNTSQLLLSVANVQTYLKHFMCQIEQNEARFHSEEDELFVAASATNVEKKNEAGDKDETTELPEPKSARPLLATLFDEPSHASPAVFKLVDYTVKAKRKQNNKDEYDGADDSAADDDGAAGLAGPRKKTRGHVVFRGVYNREPVAVRVCLSDSCVISGGSDGTDLNSVLSEAKLLEQLDHPNIQPILRYLGAPCQRSMYAFVTIQTWATEGSLRERLRAAVEETEETFVLRVAKQLLSAVSYLATRSLVHLDIKPDNVLLFPEGRLKLTDFNLTERVGTPGCDGGTLGYIAPELMRASERTARPAQDVWSVGCVLADVVGWNKATCKQWFRWRCENPIVPFPCWFTPPGGTTGLL
ncbi:UNVERIFIED_CONTAM: hypothetical protein FKN15_016159 [Acipenser sinensis]